MSEQEKDGSAPSSQASASASPSRDALDSRSVQALVQALRGVDHNLEDLRRSLYEYVRRADKKDVETLALFGRIRADVNKTNDDIAALQRLVNEVVSLARIGSSIDSTRAEDDRAAIENASKKIETASHAIDDLKKEITGTFPTYRPEDFEAGPAPDAVKRGASKLAVKIANVLWPYAGFSAKKVLAWGGALLIADSAAIWHAFAAYFRG